MKAHIAAAVAPRKGENHCDAVDRMPAHLRPLVHEYGLSTVLAFLAKGITKPQDIRHLIGAVWVGAREPGNKAANDEHRGTHRSMVALDRVMIGLGGGVPAVKLARALYHLGYAVMPYSHPTAEMVAASMAAVTGFDPMLTKKDKHGRRLSAAMHAYAKAQWGEE